MTGWKYFLIVLLLGVLLGAFWYDITSWVFDVLEHGVQFQEGGRN